VKNKFRVYLSIPQYQMIEPALRSAELPRTHRLFLTREELDRLWIAMRDIHLGPSAPIAKFRTYGALTDLIARAREKAKKAEETPNA
jgi:hypothetical protein